MHEAQSVPSSRADEVRDLLNAVGDLIVPFIRSADEGTVCHDRHSNGAKGANGANRHVQRPGTAIVDFKHPEELRDILQLNLPDNGTKQAGLVDAASKVLRYSVNTWHQGFMDKLYASTNPPGVAAELILAALNANVHVYHASPALTVVEKHTGERLANLLGLTGPRAGGISVQGGSASNTTSIVIARNNLYPETKDEGNAGHRFVLFTSSHGHYSIEKAAQILGLGGKAAWAVPVDNAGRMIASELERLVQKAKAEGRTPFYVNATAGTTVLGSFDPFPEIAAICRKHGLWMHVDGSWGGSFAFSPRQRAKLAGAHLADSITINPHKMLGAPLTCSFLLAADLRKFHRANTLPAGYLFHNDENGPGDCGDADQADANAPEVWDLADLTLQCGRRADSLKLFLGWTYYGADGYAQQIDSACDVAVHLATLVSENPNFILVSSNPPSCLQVCFYFAQSKQMIYPPGCVEDEALRGKLNSKVTEQVVHAIVDLGFMLDFAPPSNGYEGSGKFFRCVANVNTQKETMEALLHAIEAVGPGIVKSLNGKHTNGACT